MPRFQSNSDFFSSIFSDSRRFGLIPNDSNKIPKVAPDPWTSVPSIHLKHRFDPLRDSVKSETTFKKGLRAEDCYKWLKTLRNAIPTRSRAVCRFFLLFADRFQAV